MNEFILICLFLMLLGIVSLIHFARIAEQRNDPAYELFSILGAMLAFIAGVVGVLVTLSKVVT